MGNGQAPHLSFGERCAKELRTEFLAKLLRFQRTFLEKSFVSGFGAEATTFNAYTKKRGNAAFFIIGIMCWRTAVPNLALRGFL